jgi:hypothetical protein
MTDEEYIDAASERLKVAQKDEHLLQMVFECINIISGRDLLRVRYSIPAALELETVQLLRIATDCVEMRTVTSEVHIRRLWGACITYWGHCDI